jgi:hypothetical protein
VRCISLVARANQFPRIDLRLATNQRIEGWVVAMSNNYWDEEEEDDLDTDTNVGDGSDLLKKLRKAKRSDEKRIKELTEQLEGLSKVQRERTIKEVLEKKGVNAKAARLIMKDLEDINEETVNNWLDDNADLFGLKVEESKNPEQESNRAALRQQDIVTQNALTPERTEDLQTKISNAESAEEILAILQANQ